MPSGGPRFKVGEPSGDTPGGLREPQQTRNLALIAANTEEGGLGGGIFISPIVKLNI